ncbi:MAG TPA: HD domain-containing protein [Candidatus Ozemobacteraceae bacterium]|nr:HD domain-containing protein [Candidatus Ozemobacteraceae bacterium]
MQLLVNLFRRILYRCRQFISVLRPTVDAGELVSARGILPVAWRESFDALGLSEKAHVLRLVRQIRAARDISEDERSELLLLAVTHDLGKTVTKPRVWERVLRTLFSLPNEAHPGQSARILRELGAPRDLIRRVRHHHHPAGNDRLLALFQKFDDNL